MRKGKGSHDIQLQCTLNIRKFYLSLKKGSATREAEGCFEQEVKILIGAFILRLYKSSAPYGLGRLAACICTQRVCLINP